MLNFILTNSVCRLSLMLLSLHVRVEYGENMWIFYQIQHNFRCSEYLCNLGKEYFNALTCMFYSFIDKILQPATFDIWCLSFINHRKVSAPKTFCFLAYFVYITLLWGTQAWHVLLHFNTHSFTCHLHDYPQNMPHLPLLPATKYYRLSSHSVKARRLRWPGWLAGYIFGLCTPSGHQSQ